MQSEAQTQAAHDANRVIEINNVSTRFGGHVVHAGLDLEVRRAEIFALIGGSGKVVLTKGKNILRGDRLIVDMTTGTSRVESTSGPVQAVFESSGGSGQPGAGPTSILPGAKK